MLMKINISTNKNLNSKLISIHDLKIVMLLKMDFHISKIIPANNRLEKYNEKILWEIKQNQALQMYQKSISMIRPKQVKISIFKNASYQIIFTTRYCYEKALLQ